MAKATMISRLTSRPDQLRRAEILRRRAHAEPGVGARHEPAERGQRHGGEHDRHHVDLR